MTAPDTQPPAWALRVAQEIEDTCALPESYAHEIAAIIARECPVGELAGALQAMLDFHAADCEEGCRVPEHGPAAQARAALAKLA
jgi:hypothetical protein